MARSWSAIKGLNFSTKKTCAISIRSRGMRLIWSLRRWSLKANGSHGLQSKQRKMGHIPSRQEIRNAFCAPSEIISRQIKLYNHWRFGRLSNGHLDAKSEWCLLTIRFLIIKRSSSFPHVWHAGSGLLFGLCEVCSLEQCAIIQYGIFWTTRQ